MYNGVSYHISELITKFCYKAGLTYMNCLPESLTLNLIKISWPIIKIKFGGCLHQLPIVEEFQIAIQERYE